MKNIKKIGYIILVLLLKTKTGFSASIDTTILTNPQSVYINSAPITFNNLDYVKGFVSFKWGFSGNYATVNFGSVGIVNRAVALVGGTLVLTDDLYLGIGSYLLGPGTIQLNGHSIIFSSDTGIGTVSPGGAISFTGNGSLIGKGGSIGFNAGAFNFTGAGIVNFYNMVFYFVRSTSFYTAPSTVFNFYNVSFGLDVYSHTQFTWNSQINIVDGGYLKINGIGTRTIFPNTGPTLGTQSSFTMGYGTTIRLSGNTSGINGTDLSSQFHLDNATLEFSGTNNQISGLQFIIDGNSTINSITKSGSLYFGTGVGSPDTKFVINPGSKLIVGNNTTIQYQCAN
jgi:hypothetical protein